MSAILNSLNVHNFFIFQPILMTLVSKFMVQRALSDKTYLLLGLRSPLSERDMKKTRVRVPRCSESWLSHFKLRSLFMLHGLNYSFQYDITVTFC